MPGVPARLSPLVWGRAPSPVQAERSSAAVRGHSNSEFALGAPAEAGPEAQGGTIPKVPGGWLALEKLPLLLLSAVSAAVTMQAQKAGGAVQTLSQYSFLLRLETAVISYVGYLGKALWPSKLVALYPHPTKLYPAWQVAAAVLVLVLVTALVLRSRDRRYLAVGWFWFLGSLVPMIGLVQAGAQAMADRYAYLPFVGLFLMMTWLVADWAKTHRLPGKWLAIPAVSCLLVLATLTYRQVSYWHDIPSFWLRTLALTENNYIAHDTLGAYLASQGQTEEAAAHFRAALAIRPDDLPANLNLGTYEHGRGNLPAAIERYQLVAAYTADVGLRAAAYGNLGSAYRPTNFIATTKRDTRSSRGIARTTGPSRRRTAGKRCSPFSKGHWQLPDQCDTNRRDETRAVLAEIYNWFNEGFDTPDLTDAKSLLDELNE